MNLIIDRQYIANLFKLSTGIFVSQIVGLVALPIISRQYGVEILGDYVLIISVVTVLQSISTFQYENVIQVTKSKNNGILCFYLSAGLSVIFSLCLIPIIITVYNFSEYFNYKVLFLLAPIVFFNSVYNSYINLLIRLEDYNKLSFMRIIQSVSMYLFIVLFGLLLQNIVSIISGIFLSGLMLFIYIFFSVPKIKFNKIIFLKFKVLFKKYRNFLYYSSPGNILGTITGQIPVYLISYFYGSSYNAYYYYANRILNLPIQLLGSSFSNIFINEFASKYNSRINPILYLNNTWYRLFIVGVTIFILIFIFAGDISYILFGPGWSEVQYVIKVLSPVTLFIFISSPTSIMYNCFNFQKISLIFGVATCFYRPISILVGYWIGGFYYSLVLFSIFESINIFYFNKVALGHLNNDIIWK